MKRIFKRGIAVFLFILAGFLLVFLIRQNQNRIKTAFSRFPEERALIRAKSIALALKELPEGYRKMSQAEKDRKHFNNLLALKKRWDEKKVQSNAAYGLWQNGEIILLSGMKGTGALLKNRQIKQIVNANVRTGGESFHQFIETIYFHLYGIRAKRGYLIKLAPDEGMVPVREEWKNVEKYLSSVYRQPEITYIILDKGGKNILKLPADIPETAESFQPSADSLYQFGDIIEVSRIIPKKNLLLRLGFDKKRLFPGNTRLPARFYPYLFSISIFALLFISFLLWFSSLKPGGGDDLFRKILDSSKVLIVVLRDGGEVYYYNKPAAEKIGDSKEEIEARLPEMLPEVKDKIENNEGFENIAVSIGDVYWNLSGKPIASGKGENYYLLAGFNISGEEEKARQKQLEERLKAMNILASGIAHEVRNPLNAVSMIFQRLKSEYPPAESDEEYKILTSTLSREISRLDMLIDSFLALTRPLKINLERFALKPFFEELLLVIQAEIGSDNIKIEYELSPEDLTLYSDRNLIKQVLINFIRNAADALSGRGNGLIRIFAGEDNDSLRIGVSDNGIGMDQKQKEEILNPFYTTKSEGTGLGLSIVQKIITQLNGKLEINSVKNIGSEFAVRFENENKHTDS